MGRAVHDLAVVLGKRKRERLAYTREAAVGGNGKINREVTLSDTSPDDNVAVLKGDYATRGHVSWKRSGDGKSAAVACHPTHGQRDGDFVGRASLHNSGGRSVTGGTRIVMGGKRVDPLGKVMGVDSGALCYDIHPVQLGPADAHGGLARVDQPAARQLAAFDDLDPASLAGSTLFHIPRRHHQCALGLSTDGVDVLTHLGNRSERGVGRCLALRDISDSVPNHGELPHNVARVEQQAVELIV
jgi:hypothetical protein